MFRVVLVEPEIPPNTGNIIRLCANTGASLHLIRPLGFELDDTRLRRAGLDYHEWATVQVHEQLDEALAGCDTTRCFALSTKGRRDFYQTKFVPGDTFVFGPETRGLSPSMMQRFAANQVLRLPMRPSSRSLNLSNAVAVAVFEAWRQIAFAGAALAPPERSDGNT